MYKGTAHCVHLSFFHRSNILYLFLSLFSHGVSLILDAHNFCISLVSGVCSIVTCIKLRTSSPKKQLKYQSAQCFMEGFRCQLENRVLPWFIYSRSSPLSPLVFIFFAPLHSCFQTKNLGTDERTQFDLSHVAMICRKPQACAVRAMVCKQLNFKQ